MAVNIFGPLQRSKTCSQLVIITTDRYTVLTGAIPTTKIESIEVGNIFFSDYISPYGITDTVLSDNGQQFVSKFSTSA